MLDWIFLSCVQGDTGRLRFFVKDPFYGDKNVSSTSLLGISFTMGVRYRIRRVHVLGLSYAKFTLTST